MIVLKKYLIILTLGLAYLIWVLLTDLRIPCPLYALTGIKCPGCGVTRMICSLARLDLRTAFGFNPFLLVTGPLIITVIALPEYRFVRHGSYLQGWERHLLIPLLVAAIAFGVLRNIF